MNDSDKDYSNRKVDYSSEENMCTSHLGSAIEFYVVDIQMSSDTTRNLLYCYI